MSNSNTSSAAAGSVPADDSFPSGWDNPGFERRSLQQRGEDARGAMRGMGMSIRGRGGSSGGQRGRGGKRGGGGRGRGRGGFGGTGGSAGPSDVGGLGGAGAPSEQPPVGQPSGSAGAAPSILGVWGTKRKREEEEFGLVKKSKNDVEEQMSAAEATLQHLNINVWPQHEKMEVGEFTRNVAKFPVGSSEYTAALEKHRSRWSDNKARYRDRVTDLEREMRACQAYLDAQDQDAEYAEELERRARDVEVLAGEKAWRDRLADFEVGTDIHAVELARDREEAQYRHEVVLFGKDGAKTSSVFGEDGLVSRIYKHAYFQAKFDSNSNMGAAVQQKQWDKAGEAFEDFKANAEEKDWPEFSQTLFTEQEFLGRPLIPVDVLNARKDRGYDGPDGEPASDMDLS